jgi:hypothetical protein
MQNLLDKYRATRTLSLARKIRAHDRAHTMAACLLSPLDVTLLADALRHANVGA